MHRNQVKFGHLKHGARFTKYLTAILRLSCDNVKDAIDVRRTSIICGFDDCGSILNRVSMLLTSVVGDAAIHLIVQTMLLWSQLKEFFYFQCYADVRRNTRELRDRETDTLIAVLRPVDGSCEGGCMRDESAPIQLAQCRFRGLAISDAKMSIHFSNKIPGSNFCQSPLGNCCALKLA